MSESSQPSVGRLAEHEAAGFLLRLHPADNVLVALRSIPAGARLRMTGAWLTVEEAVSLGHKVAAQEIPAGGKIIKYGVPIGSATVTIRAGQHVHLHNLRSDYLKTHARGEGEPDERPA